MRAVNEYDEKTIMEKSVLDELFSIEDDYEQADRLIALTERAYDFGKKYGDEFKKRYAAYKRQRIKEEKARKAQKPEALMHQTEFGYFEDGHELECGNWIANGNGILQYNPYGMANLACHHPVLITKILRNAETNTFKVRLAYKIAGEWSEITVDKELIASATKITKLAKYGLDATSENARYLVKFLSDMENMNVGSIERKVSTSKFGWVGGDFIPYGMDIEFDGEARFMELYESVKEKGSCEKWMACVKKVRGSGRKEPLVYLAGSFASILLEQMNLPSFVINLWEKSGGGKTVSMMVASSVWGNPKIGRFTTDVKATGTNIEVMSDVLNHLPLLIDDLSQVKENYKDAFSELVYAWCSGKGKGRSNQDLGLQRTYTWNNVTMTNYERPLATESMRGGAVNRVLDFRMEPGIIFTKEAGNETVSVITKNYGFAGKMFVELVKRIGIPKIRELQRYYLGKIDDYCTAHGEEKEDKQKLPLSIMLAADRLATDYIFKDGIYLDFEWCIKQLKSTDDVSESQRAYVSIMDDVSIHVNNFNPDDDGNYRGEFWGGIKDGFAFIVPAVFEKMAERYNFSSKAFLLWAKEEGLLKYDKGKNQKTERIPRTAPARKFYAIKMPVEETEEVTEARKNLCDNSEFVQIGKQEELPFD